MNEETFKASVDLVRTIAKRTGEILYRNADFELYDTLDDLDSASREIESWRNAIKKKR